MDVGTGLEILGTGIGGRQLIEKILGPTADYIGVGLKGWTEKRVQNVSRIFSTASEKLGDKINSPGTVPPRVLKEILDDGSYCDEELVAEYFGGVLASSRTDIDRDDRASAYLKLVSGLSSYEVRLHYISYFVCRDLFKGSGLRSSYEEDLNKMWFYLPDSFLGVAMDFAGNENRVEILMESLTGLARQSLIVWSTIGSADVINEENRARGWREVEEQGLNIRPTLYGINFWLWAIGLGQTRSVKYLDADLKLPSLPNVEFPYGPLKLLP